LTVSGFYKKMEKDGLNYLDIFKKSLALSWERKLLWIFGFFIFLGTASQSLSVNWKESESLKASLADFMDRSVFSGPAMLTMLIVAMLTLWLLKAVGQAAIIRSIGKPKATDKNEFRQLFFAGKIYSWRILGIDLLFNLLVVIVFLTLSLPVIFLIFAKAYALSALVGLFAVMIFIPVSVLAYFIKRFSYIYLVVPDMNMRDSMENAYLIFKNHLLKSLLFSILLFATGILLSVGFLAAIFIMGTPLLFAGLAMSLIFSKIGTYILMAVGLSILSLAFILSQSMIEAFKQISWVIFFQEIGSPRVKKETIFEKAPLADGLPRPEKA